MVKIYINLILWTLQIIRTLKKVGDNLFEGANPIQNQILLLDKMH